MTWGTWLQFPKIKDASFWSEFTPFGLESLIHVQLRKAWPEYRDNISAVRIWISHLSFFDIINVEILSGKLVLLTPKRYFDALWLLRWDYRADLSASYSSMTKHEDNIPAGQQQSGKSEPPHYIPIINDGQWYRWSSSHLEPQLSFAYSALMYRSFSSACFWLDALFTMTFQCYIAIMQKLL